ncbi:hypothetical protein THAOC_07607, partial [Thalassiosira oceanica]
TDETAETGRDGSEGEGRALPREGGGSRPRATTGSRRAALGEGRRLRLLQPDPGGGGDERESERTGRGRRRAAGRRRRTPHGRGASPEDDGRWDVRPCRGRGVEGGTDVTEPPDSLASGPSLPPLPGPGEATCGGDGDDPAQRGGTGARVWRDATPLNPPGGQSARTSRTPGGGRGGGAVPGGAADRRAEEDGWDGPDALSSPLAPWKPRGTTSGEPMSCQRATRRRGAPAGAGGRSRKQDIATPAGGVRRASPGQSGGRAFPGGDGVVRECPRMIYDASPCSCGHPPGEDALTGAPDAPAVTCGQRGGSLIVPGGPATTEEGRAATGHRPGEREARSSWAPWQIFDRNSQETGRGADWGLPAERARRGGHGTLRCSELNSDVGARSRRSREATEAEGGDCTIFALRGRGPSPGGPAGISSPGGERGAGGGPEYEERRRPVPRGETRLSDGCDNQQVSNGWAGEDFGTALWRVGIQKLCSRSPRPEEPRGDGSRGRRLHNFCPAGLTLAGRAYHRERKPRKGGECTSVRGSLEPVQRRASA